jgi:hypothetical protein
MIEVITAGDIQGKRSKFDAGLRSRKPFDGRGVEQSNHERASRSMRSLAPNVGGAQAHNRVKEHQDSFSRMF